MTLLGSLVLSLLLTQAPAANGVGVSGLVLNGRTGDPIADTKVTIVELARDARTAASGRFEFTNVPAGTYTVSVSTIGFIFVRRTVVVGEGAPVDLTIPLAEGAGTYTESVSVSAAREGETASINELSESQLQNLRGVMADDPVRALQALPGVGGGNDFRAEFSVRGAAFRQIGTVIDDTPTAQLFHTLGGQADSGSISMINTDVLSGATLSASPHARKDGDWLGATVGFDLREGSRDRAAARVAVSGTSSSVVAEGPIGPDKRGSWLVSVRKSYIGWIIERIDPTIQGTFGFVDTQTKAVYDLTPRQHVQFTGVGGLANFFRRGNASPNSVRRSSSRSALLSGAWRYVGDRTVLEQRVSFVTGRVTNSGSLLQQQAYNRDRNLIWRGDVSRDLGDGWGLAIGGQARHERLSESLHDYASVPGGGLRVTDELTFADRRVTSAAWAGLTRQTANTDLKAGARAAYDTRTGRTLASPWFVLNRKLGAFTLFAGADQSGQFPALDALGQSSTVLAPERASQAEVGIGRAFDWGLRARVSAFAREDRDGLRRASEDRLMDGARLRASAFANFASTIRASTRGADLVIERNGSRGPTGWFGYTWAHTRNRDTATGERFDGDFDQRHTVNLFLEQRLSYRMKVAAKFRYGSNYPIVGYFEGTPHDLRLSAVRNGVRLPSYARLDLNGSRTFAFPRARLTLFIELVNVTDHANFTPVEATIRNNLTTSDFVEELIPFVPSAGFLIEF